MRRNIMWFFERMGRHLQDGALEELTLTTNATQLRRFAKDLAGVGVRRLNVSLDTLDEAKFADITRWGRLAQVLDGVDAAQAGRPVDQDQLRGAEGRQRRRGSSAGRVVRRRAAST